jgi:hypothetical protein
MRVRANARRGGNIMWRTVTIVSGVLGVLVLALWARSYWRVDVVDLRTRYGQEANRDWVWRHLKTWSSMGGFIVRWERHTWTNATPRKGVERPRFGWTSARTGTDHDPGDWVGPLHTFSIDRVSNTNSVMRDGEFTSGLAIPPPGGWGTLRYDGEWLQFPQWIVAAALFIAPVVALWRARRRRKRVAAGLCGRCGYDVRVNTGRCPECGTEIAPAAGEAAVTSMPTASQPP